LVVKFGGNSLRTGSLILKSASKLEEMVKEGVKVAVVVSAMGRTTDILLKAAKGASEDKIQPHELDEVLSMGERISARIFTSALRAKGLNARLLDPSDPDWPILTDDRFFNANIFVDASIEKVKSLIPPLMDEGVIPVIPGFIGRSAKSSKITTLGRGGSDITALLVATAIDAERVVLVTDVEGVMSADPKIVEKPMLIRELTVEELIGLADVGSKFIHGKALKYKKSDIDLVMTSHQSPRFEAGTVVKGAFPELSVELLSKKPVMSLSVAGKSLMEAPEVMVKLIEEVKKSNVFIYGSSTDRDSIIMYLESVKDRGFFNKVHAIVKTHPQALAMAIRKNLALIRVKGVGLEEKPGVIESVSKPLQEHGINVFGMFTIASSIFTLVDWEERERALKLIESSLTK
jgi:aspartate kinase